MRPYNVPNDRILAPSAGGVEYKQQVAGSHRHWPLVSLQSAQSAARALVVVHGRTRQLQLAALSEAAETYSLLFKAANTIHNGRPSFLYRSEYSHDEGRSEEQA